jgi:hypothetical protein
MEEPTGITIPGVPKSIPRARYVEVIASLGFDPHELVSLEFRLDGIYATVRARGANGKAVVSLGSRNTLVEHRIFIPVEDPS